MNRAEYGSLLISGGEADSSLKRLVEVAKENSVHVYDLRHGGKSHPTFTWDLRKNSPRHENHEIRPKGAFIRYAFTDSNTDNKKHAAQRASGWYSTIYGWLLSQPDIRLLNRSCSPRVGNKPAILKLAQRCQLEVPETVITNDQEIVERLSTSQSVTKPVAGGDYCYDLSSILNTIEFRDGYSATPGFIQNKLVSPEIRIYIIGNYCFSFEMQSRSLDYRIQQDVEVIPLEKHPPEIEGLKQLMRTLKMNFGAADFKTDRDTGRLLFLELNSSPMFAAFDQVIHGNLCHAMIKTLTTS